MNRYLQGLIIYYEPQKEDKEELILSLAGPFILSKRPLFFFQDLFVLLQVYKADQ